jgi:photosystem I subunit 3
MIIDVPLALNIMLSGYLWPLTAWSEFISGSFVADSNDITVSPR